MRSLRRRRALTLIELLVVLSTLGVLTAVLHVALVEQRQTSQRTHELENLRILAQLMAKYSADDPNGVLGPIHPADHFFSGGTGYAEYGGGPGTMSYQGWGNYRDPPIQSDPNPFDPRSRPLNHYLYGRDAITPTTSPGDPSVFKPFQCLGEDRGWQNIPGFDVDPREMEPNSYFKGNGTAFRVNNLAFSGGPVGLENFEVGIVGRPVGRIPLPCQTLSLFEVRVYQTLYTNAATGVLDPVQLAGNHKKPGYFMTNYADGHGAFVDFGVNSYYPNALGGAYAGSDERGTWGRMDCWPDPATSSSGGVPPGQSPPSTPLTTPTTATRVRTLNRIPIAPTKIAGDESK